MPPSAIPSPRSNSQMTSEDVAGSVHAHWRDYGLLNEGAYFLAMQNELSKDQPDASVISECLMEIQSFVYNRSRQAVRRFIDEMREAGDEHGDLHIDSIRSAKLMWDAPTSTTYMKAIQKSIDLLNYENSALREIAVAIDPRVGPNKRPIESLVFQAFRDGRNVATRQATLDPSNSQAVDIMLSGRASVAFDPPKSAPLPYGIRISQEKEALLLSLRDNLWYGNYDAERVKSILRMLCASAEQSGFRWAGEFLQATSRDSEEKLMNRNKLLRDAGRNVSGHSPFMRELGEYADEIYDTVPMGKAAEKLMGVGSERLGDSYENFNRLEALLYDALHRGMRQRLALGNGENETTAGLDYLLEIVPKQDADLMSEDDVMRMTEASTPTMPPGMSDRDGERSKATADTLPAFTRSKSWRISNFDDLGDYYRLVVLQIAPAARHLAIKKSLEIVISWDATSRTVEIRFESRKGKGVAPATLLIHGRDSVGKTFATLDDVAVKTLVNEKVPVGSNNEFLTQFVEDPLMHSYREQGMSPIEYMMLRNMKLPLIADVPARRHGEVASKFLADAWAHLISLVGSSSISGKMLQTSKSAEFLKIEIEGCKPFIISAKGSRAWQINGDEVSQGKDAESLLAALNQHVSGIISAHRHP